MMLTLGSISAYLKMMRLGITDRQGYKSIIGVRKDGLTFLGIPPLVELYTKVRQIEEEQLEGCIIEAGTALGGSALVMATAKKTDRLLQLYDVFAMIPPPSEQDGIDAHARYEKIKAGHASGIKKNLYYGYQRDLLENIRKTFRQYNLEPQTNRIEFIQGLYKDTLNIQGPVALAHIDCDWYDSVLICLQRIVPFLVRNGTLIIDDYHHWSGCKSAVDQFFADKRDDFTFEMRSRLHITRR